METVRVRRVAGNALREVKSLCPQQCVTGEQRVERKEERGRIGKGGREHHKSSEWFLIPAFACFLIQFLFWERGL